MNVDSAVNSSWLHIRKIPKKGISAKDIELSLHSSFESLSVNILRIVLLHGRGQALVHIDSDDKAIEELFKLLPASSPEERLLVVDGWSNPLILQRGKPRINSSLVPEANSLINRSYVALEVGWNVNDMKIITMEVNRALKRIVRQIVHEDNVNRETHRRENKRKFREDMRLIDMKRHHGTNLSTDDEEGTQSASATMNMNRTNICWEYVRQGGRRMCCESSPCIAKGLLHVLLPVSELPSHLRAFVLDDSFPLSREVSSNYANAFNRID
jgi:hypothetical protein